MGSISSTSPSVVKADSTPYFTPANNAGAAVNPDDPNTPTLFKPLRIRDVTLKNRIIVSPMCMYSAESNPASPFVGALTDYHIAHLGQFALKGAGLVFVEAQAVQPNGRISPHDVGLWQEGTDSEQFKGLQRVVQFSHSQGAKVAVQLAHAGRKASVFPPWVAAQAGKPSLRADESVFGWPKDVVGPSGGEENIWDPAEGTYWAPRELSTAEIKEVVQAFAKSAELAVKAGVDVIEIHAAHGYLLNQFLSPATNKRTDEYGGSFENRVRIVREVATAVRAVIPKGMPLFLRISATDWLEGQPAAAESGSWDLESSLRLVEILPELGIDLVDVSSGGVHKDQKIKLGPGYQVDLAGELRKAIRKAGASTLVGGVGLITEAEQAQSIVQGADEAQQAEAIVTAKADVVLLARQFLREPEWVIITAKKYVPWTEEKGDITACGIPIPYNASKEWADKKVVLFSVPGAFTPTCSVNHVPGYIQNLPQLKEKGVQVVAVVASNDPFVMSAWGKANKVERDDILFLSDPDAKFSDSIGWANNGRTGRYAIVIDHGKVTYAQIETEKGVVKVSGAEAVLAHL
ncbi:FMN-linked oxidoreductase [Aspergillus novoparasiticus]|uniref:Thioredoxin peroxidase n=1 Tax=Aspergillus novoparasiticus TaxID=986946 RepID=A0A5N6EHW6_9EURO|nr:FMN-linked oxidoreductase [Aspergillus novoparasiticus]